MIIETKFNIGNKVTFYDFDTSSDHIGFIEAIHPHIFDANDMLPYATTELIGTSISYLVRYALYHGVSVEVKRNLFSEFELKLVDQSPALCM